MDRPARRNAMSGEMLAGLASALADVERDPAVRCVVLTGAGGAFCAGGDVKGFAEGSASSGPSFDERVHNQRLQQRAVSGVLWKMPKPTLAVLPGPAAGAGLSLALACDLRVAVEGAVITTAFAKVGFSGDYGGSWFLTQLVGAAKARELYYLSDRVDSAEALRLGILNAVYPAASFEQEAGALARRLAEGPSIAYRYMKENINRAMTEDLVECLDMEALHHLHCGTTEDHLESSKAFVEKRPPVFHGR
ncbi:MAG: enoyl-CoA hydratase [Acidimicrobiia bacterium]|nr:enoyl-CoA hydratase [Acidimicrobiia bacterium]